MNNYFNPFNNEQNATTDKSLQEMYNEGYFDNCEFIVDPEEEEELNFDD